MCYKFTVRFEEQEYEGSGKYGLDIWRQEIAPLPHVFIVSDLMPASW